MWRQAVQFRNLKRYERANFCSYFRRCALFLRYQFVRNPSWSGRRLGRCDWRNHRWCGHWSRSWRGDWRSRRRSGWRFNGRSNPRRSSCTLWSAAARRLSICALGRNAWFLSQPLYRARVRSSRSPPGWADSRCRYRPAFPQTVTDFRRSPVSRQNHQCICA